MKKFPRDKIPRILELQQKNMKGNQTYKADGKFELKRKRIK